ncbi:hypothetical protein HA402_003788 [Bradysia odoriphaga]|nr:hypothetical protein HA402_003788 [Bradysia odoriphaga]
MKCHIAFIILGLTYCAVVSASVARVDETIWKNLDQAATTNVKITFKKTNTKAAFDRFNSLKLTSRNAKLNSQYSILKDHSDVVQADVIFDLKKASAHGKKHEIAQLWISSELIVRNVDKEVVEMLSVHPDVASLESELIIRLDDVMARPSIVSGNNTISNYQWGVVNVGAPEVWNAGNRGTGAVVGVIDTGARATHVALRYTYRGNQPGQNHNYNWYAPTGHDAAPNDNQGHGTHVIGSAVGTEGIGVAPGSYWIACRGCISQGCTNFDLLQCGNWMACPTNTVGAVPDCSKAPNVVNNSWGGGTNNPWYDAIISAWRNVDIVPIFSAGNAGFTCETLTSPGDRPLAISVGATLANNQRSGLSSMGPTVDGRINPFIVAPGNEIYSASHMDDTSFLPLSGSSMAAPHVAGVVSLLFSRNPNLNVAQVATALRAGAIPHAAVGGSCGGIPDDTYPNNHVGYGRIWAPAAINSIPPLL